MDSMPEDGVITSSEATESVSSDVKGHTNDEFGNLTDTKHIHREDVVRHKDGNMFGVVVEVAGESDSESETTDDDESEYDGEEEEEDEEMEVKDNEENADGEEEEEVEPKEDDEGCDVDNEERNMVRNNKVNGSGEESRTGGYRNGGSLSAGQVRVLWLDNSETTHHFNDLIVVDRSFLHGDYVASASNPIGQLGLVVDVNLYVDLLSTDGSFIKDVSTRGLRRVRDLTVGDYVVYGPWLGRVDDVVDNVTVLFDDGSVCRVMRADPVLLGPKDKKLIRDEECPFYPGQRVRARSSSIFKNSVWLSGSWKAKNREGTVIKVTAGSVFIHWIASAGYGTDSSSTPAVEQYPKNLKLLSCFSHANWQFGDWCLLPSSATSSSVPLENDLSLQELEEDPGTVRPKCDVDAVISEGSNRTSIDLHQVSTASGASHFHASSKSSSSNNAPSLSKESIRETVSNNRKKLRKNASRRDKKMKKKEETFEKAHLIINIKTRVDVAWQNGVVERQVSSTSLISVETPGDHDFIAEQYVVEKGSGDSGDASEIRRVGVVKSVNAEEKTACVKWLNAVANPEDLREFDKEEIVSVYELEGHPDYDYCYGDVVVRLSPVCVANDANSSKSMEGQRQQDGSNALKCDTETLSGLDKTDYASMEEAYAEFTDLSWVGNITGLKNGDIEVTWADGMISRVGPQAIYVVGRDDDDASVSAGSDFSDAASWETVEDDKMDAQENEEEPASPKSTNVNQELGNNSVDENTNVGSIGLSSMPLACIGFVAKLASGIFSRARNKKSSETDNAAEKEDPLGDASFFSGRTYGHAPNSQGCSVNGNDLGQTSDEKSEVGGAESKKLSIVGQDVSPTDDGLPTDRQYSDSSSFKRFDTAKDPLDHYFLLVNAPGNNDRKWLKKVQQDWSILQNNLPGDIYVRVYEDRMDLLRAVLVGAYGTPYQDGLFFFDFHLPPEYPDVPPSAHYHSGGWRINPNLYEEGKVCLSLLNTWSGRGNEVWDPKSSSILQVLVSLQGLVLNSKPYFNEAGYDKQVGTAEGEKNSLSYNENTFLLNCKTIMYIIRKPPKDFEMFVKDHFKRRGYYILKACDAYMKGYLIGSLRPDASVSDKSEANATSVGFKLMLAKIVPKLFTALSEVGANCSEFEHLQQV